MKYQLAQGVTLHIIPSRKYTTNHILVNFASKQTPTNSAPRNLLVNLLCNASQKYPNQTAIARHLANMYGAELDGYVVRMGMTHNVRFSLTLVNNHSIKSDLTEMAVDFLAELIFNPLHDGQVLSPNDWQRQKSNLVAMLSSWDDDKQYLAAKNLLRLYFTDHSVMQMPSVGTVPSIRNVSSADLYKTYQQMLSSDQVDIFVQGDVDPARYLSLFQQWPLKARQPLDLGTIFYHQPLYDRLQEKTDYQVIQQTKLDLAYSFPIYFMDRLYYPALVMNSLFGASPYSMLFANVREKASLAYYASSVYRPFGGYLFVQSGINGKDRRLTQQLIESQVQDMQDGKFDLRRFEQAKRSLINAYLAACDNPNQLIDQELVATLTGIPVPKNSVQRIDQVTPQLVSQTAQQLKLQAIYCLDRRENYE